VRGEANAGSGQTFGVHGINASDGGIGVFGYANNVAGTGAPIGVKGGAQSSTGIGVFAQNSNSLGSTVGMQAEVSSPSGTAGLFNNIGGGKILSGQNNGVEKFSVDGSGNLVIGGTITGNGSGLTNIAASTLAAGTYANTFTFSSPSNSFTGNGSGLTNLSAAPTPGSANYIQNGATLQAAASFNIGGNGTVGGNLAAGGNLAITGTLTGNGSGLTNIAASTLNAGTYANVLTFSNASNSFTGNGSGLTNVTATGLAAGFYPNQVTFANALNDIRGNGASLTNVNAASVASRSAANMITRAITYLAGCESCSALTTADSQPNIFFNALAPMTVGQVTCFADTGSPVINLQRENGGGTASILSQNLTCTTAGATTVTFAQSTINLNDKINFVISDASTAHRITLSITTTIN
jgi:hypothetical protein